ncbi:MAG: hypothetical protein JW795_03330, partial [Chitinivibrionales bacterium]|nr:hypothetical protein [Chitinivibrionales bacterium]
TTTAKFHYYQPFVDCRAYKLKGLANVVQRSPHACMCADLETELDVLTTHTMTDRGHTPILATKAHCRLRVLCAVVNFYN